MTRRPLVVLAVAALLLAAIAPAAAADGSSLDVDVEQANDGDATVAVEHNGTALENATVAVSTADANDTYDGAGEYTTDENGTVALPAPEETVSVVIEATCDCANGSASVDLVAPSLEVTVEQATDASATASVAFATTDEPAANATVTVSPADGNESYVGTGTYTTDADGAVDLPAPTKNVTVEVEAEYGNQSGATEADLLIAESTSDGDAPFGDRVSSYVHWLLGQDREGGIGQAVAEFVTANNPGNAPEHAGPPENGSNGPDETGPPEHAGNGNESASGSGDGGASASNAGGNGDRGPPDHAGPDGDGPPGNDRGEVRGPPN